jgi:hypothetical protein
VIYRSGTLMRGLWRRKTRSHHKLLYERCDSARLHSRIVMCGVGSACGSSGSMPATSQDWKGRATVILSVNDEKL